MNVDEEHRQFDRKLSDLERLAEEQAALLRRIQIELELFVEDEEEVKAHPANNLH